MTDLHIKSRHLLTVLVEDYFHVGAFDNLIQQRNWGKFDPRYERNTHKALDLLDEYSTKATFFVLGWIAEQNPDLVREIADRGHEVASRGYYHRGLKNLSADEFRSDVRRTNDVIEAVTGRPAVGFRAAEKLHYKSDEWIFEILADEGFAYDASFIPTRFDDKRQRAAHQIHTGGRALWEFPYSTRDLGVGLLPISGGNYFRQIPYTFTRGSVKSWARDNDAPFVSYFHVWELDPEQPRISAASRFNRLRHYRKLDKMEWILRENLDLYDCVSVADHLGLVESPVRERLSEPTVSVRLTEAVAPKAGIPVTIVIPCYNEQDSLAYLANTLTGVEEKLVATGYSPEILFVNDKSTDATLDRLETLFADRNNVRIVSHDVNKGVAAAIMTGIRESETDIVCSMDCDCTYDPEELVNLLPLLKDGVDLVTASPYHPDGGVRNVPGWRLFLSRGASFLYRSVLSSDLSTYTSCFRAYRRNSFVDLELEENGFLGVAEMLGKLDIAGGRIVEFPTTLDVRLFGFSKMKTARTIFGHIKLLTRLAKQRLFRNNQAIKTSIPLEEKAP